MTSALRVSTSQSTAPPDLDPTNICILEPLPTTKSRPFSASIYTVTPASVRRNMVHNTATDCLFDEYKTLCIHELRHLTARVPEADPKAEATQESDNLSKILTCYQGRGHLTASSGSRGTIVYQGALLTKKQSYNSSSEESERVVLKIGFGDDAVQRLLREHGFYQRLLPLQGDQIPLCYGLYRGDMDTSNEAWSTTVACLLLEDCGDPCNLRKMPWAFRFVPHISTKLHGTDCCWWRRRHSRKSVVQCIELLHKAYGIQHNQFGSKHVLIRRVENGAKPCIVGFEEATDHKCPIRMCIAEEPWKIASPDEPNPCKELIQLATVDASIWIPSTPP